MSADRPQTARGAPRRADRGPLPAPSARLIATGDNLGPSAKLASDIGAPANTAPANAAPQAGTPPAKRAAPPGAAARAPAERRIELTVNWIGDRFGQRITWRDPTGIVAVLESVEGDACEAWPTSPPWQQIETASPGDPERPVWLALGMAGRSHWSASIAAAAEALGDEPLLIWDVACRLHAPPDFLGHTFHWVHRPPDSTERWLDRAVQIEPLVEPVDAPIAGNRQPAVVGRRPHADGLQVWLAPQSRAYPHTVRWKLTFRFPRLP